LEVITPRGGVFAENNFHASIVLSLRSPTNVDVGLRKLSTTYSLPRNSILFFMHVNVHVLVRVHGFLNLFLQAKTPLRGVGPLFTSSSSFHAIERISPL